MKLAGVFQASRRALGGSSNVVGVDQKLVGNCSGVGCATDQQQDIDLPGWGNLRASVNIRRRTSQHIRPGAALFF
jgi:hypothetical protein